jgi:hypothetical protein
MELTVKSGATFALLFAKGVPLLTAAHAKCKVDPNVKTKMGQD